VAEFVLPGSVAENAVTNNLALNSFFKDNRSSLENTTSHSIFFPDQRRNSFAMDAIKQTFKRCKEQNRVSTPS
jgi:hypothetical protein